MPPSPPSAGSGSEFTSATSSIASDLFGDGVNVASRIAPLAEPQGVCISAQVYDHVWNKISLPLASMGKQALKNVRMPTEVYCVAFPWSEVRPEEPRPVDRTRIAVLPLTNISPGPADAFFADGMTEELVFQLVDTQTCPISTWSNSRHSVRNLPCL